MRVACLKPFSGLCLKWFVWVLLAGLVAPGNAWSQEEKPGEVPTGEAATTGSLAVSGSFNGASILLDGEDTGKRTPAVLTGLAPGPHVVVARSRCLGARAKVKVVVGVETAVDMKMVQGKGRLKISSHPRQAAITVDGVAIGNAPIISNPLTCGEHVVEANSIGHESVSRIVDLPAFTKRRIHLTLQPLPPGAIAEALVGATATVEAAAPETEVVEAAAQETEAEEAAAGDTAEAPEAEGVEAAAPETEAVEATAGDTAAAPEATAAELPAEAAVEAPTEETAEAPTEAATEPVAGAPESAVAEVPAETPSENGAVTTPEGETVSSEAPEKPEPAAPVTLATQVVISGGVSQGGLSETRGYAAGSLGLGTGLGVVGILQHRKAKEAFFRFLDEPNDNLATLIYNDEVVPPKRLSYVMYGGSAVALATGTFLWIRDDVALMPGSGGLVVSGRW